MEWVILGFGAFAILYIGMFVFAFFCAFICAVVQEAGKLKKEE